MRIFMFLAAAALAANASAASVFKCVDAAGRITFTQQSCPQSSLLHDVVSASSPTPSGSSQPVAMAATPEPAGMGRAGRPRASGIGASAPQAGCNTGLNAQDLRKAKVRNEIVPGMSRKDIEDMYGKAGRGGSARGAGASTYWNDKYVDVTSVSYDRNGCVRSSYQSGHKR